MFMSQYWKHTLIVLSNKTILFNLSDWALVGSLKTSCEVIALRRFTLMFVPSIAKSAFSRERNIEV